MLANLKKLEASTGAKLGAAQNPLLVSVRSGAKFSMPGMMDTILNLGLNDVSVEGLKQRTSNGRFAYDSYRRFIQMFGSVVLEIPKADFEHEFEDVKKVNGAKLDTDLTESALKDVVARYKKLVRAKSRKDFPQDPLAQLRGARDAVFRSWQNPRAKEYRRIYDIDERIGTAVNVQAMVFGNTGDRSGTGVGFTRNPATGAQGVLRRVPDQRPGRGRGGRHPHAEADRRARSRDAEGLQAAARHHDAAREALQGRAGLRVHDPGRAAVHAADAQRQAHRLRGGRDRHGPGGREAGVAERTRC
jgi:hypothetical protein